MKDWKKTIISHTLPIIDAIGLIEESSLQIALAVDENSVLLGTVTDGDVRRGILQGLDLNRPVSDIMNVSPTVAHQEDSDEKILNIMKSQLFHHIPILNSQGKVVSLKTLDESVLIEGFDNWVILMAGGMGTRLSPLTDEKPKPLIKVGETPVLELVLKNCIESNLRKFFISVNYKAEMVKNYFGDGSRWGVDIQYLHEDQQMGTAGSISLLPLKPEKPCFVMNCDLVTNINLRNILNFHLQNKAVGTMCVREYQFQVPYGVVELDDSIIQNINEKPIQKFFINAGIYVLNPHVLNLIKKNFFLDMPDLFKLLISENAKTAAYPIREYWLDIGQLSDLEKANNDFKNNNKINN
jgi:dTDP-glucose pyrophosphorylase